MWPDNRRCTALLWTLTIIAWAAATALAGGPKERVPIGEFTARMMAAPTIDGRIEPGEWDGALTTAGMMTPFGHEMHQAPTRMSLGFDEKNFYFLFRCRRGNREWRLVKSVRENDDYSFGDPSIEIWISPPTLVPETYQNVINTYPAVLDQKMIPTRGYTAQGWKGNWVLGVTEDEKQYVIEAAIPIKDFGFEKATGETWRFLLCRTSPRTKPRAQASWSITQGFAEIATHPKVHMKQDAPVLQFYEVISMFTGKYELPMAVAAPRGKAAEIDVTLQLHKGVKWTDGEPVEKRRFSLKAGERKTFTFKGDTGEMKIGHFTIKAATADGTVFFRQTFPFKVNDYVPEVPRKPAHAKVEELDLWPMYGPVTNTLLLRADIIDLPSRERVRSGRVRVLDEKTGQVLKEQPLGPFRNWYSSAHTTLDGVKIPVFDPEKHYKPSNKKKAPEGKTRFEPRRVKVEVSVFDAAGKLLRTNAKVLDLLQYDFKWQNNDIGVSEKVIPPWTPVQVQDDQVSVWNRQMQVDGLGLLRGIRNGKIDQGVRMRIVAVRDGKEIEVEPSRPALQKRVDAWADLSGTGTGAGLKLSAHTRVEFDGFTLIDLTIAPDGRPTRLDRLYLEIVLPESEATHYCTTAGGWAAVHDVTPAYWNSLMTASGMLVRDFVPYMWLTNSDRAFLWFADHDKGWITGTDKKIPTMEMWRQNDVVKLHVKFIEMPTELKAPTTVQFGYQTFPSRPLPDGWRTIVCSNRDTMIPSARNTYFWFDGNWAVLWPYYCSPYPWDMEKSKKLFDRYPKDTNHRPGVGSIAHSIGRYRDYEGNTFDAYAVDWGETPGNRGNANITNSDGVNDFRLYHYQRWVREAGFRCLYIDENYLGLESNFLTGNAYHLPDGRLQRAYSYIGLRDYFKRMKYMYHANDVPPPNLWQHISSGAAYNAWFGDAFFEGENVEPTDLKWDYMEVLPAGRMRAIGSSKCAGGAMSMMCQSQRHRTVYEPKHTHQFVGWVMAHDILPEQVHFWYMMAQESRFYRGDVQFLPYWKKSTPVKAVNAGCLVSAHAVPGRAVLWVVNTTRKDQNVDVSVDYQALGLDPAKTLTVDAETGEPIARTATGLRVPVLQRDFIGVQLVERNKLQENQTLYASFDSDAAITDVGVKADEAVGSEILPKQRARGKQEQPLRLVAGRKGKALAMDAGLVLWPHLHLSNKQGRIQFHVLLKDGAQGGLLDAGRLGVQLSRDGIALSKTVYETFKDKQGRERRRPRQEQVTAKKLDAGWHLIDLAWQDGKATLSVDGNKVAEQKIDTLGFAEGRGHDLEKPTFINIGGSRNNGIEAIDELKCFAKP